MTMTAEESALIGFKKPSWLHPFKRMKYNNIVRDIKIASLGISRLRDKLAPLFLQDHDNMMITMTFCTNRSGDMVKHRAAYTFNGHNNLNDRKNFEEFNRKVLSAVNV